MHMLVIDDESDDASILDANKTKSIPYYITRLWAGVDAVKISHRHLVKICLRHIWHTLLLHKQTSYSHRQTLSPSDFLMALEHLQVVIQMSLFVNQMA